MSQSLVDVILHVVFSTKGRAPWIKPDIEETLYQYIGGVCRQLDCPVIKINGVEDHIPKCIQKLAGGAAPKSPRLQGGK